jgi:small GTP-binding protein
MSTSQRSIERPRKRQLKFLVLGAAGAGKTSLLRRYFYKQFDYERMPTVGSDFYVGRIRNPIRVSKDNNEPDVPPDDQIPINIQMWDTPGKENFALHRQQRHIHYSATLSDSFFQHANAIMLVYDMTSSTSFTRLLKWYGDLMELFTKTAKPLPILIVANKLDLFQADKPGARHPPRKVPQRNVMGLSGDYYGQNFHYEYQISSSENQKDNDTASLSTDKSDNSGGKPGIKATKRHMEISSYLVNRDNWTTDGSYLDSLLHSEDGSLPDREMVLLWCMRNGLNMVEISAATGEGVNEAIEALVTLALEEQTKIQAETVTQPSPTSEISTTATTAVDCSSAEGAGAMAVYASGRPNEELDLQRRYAKQDNNCFWFIPSFRHCLK